MTGGLTPPGGPVLAVEVGSLADWLGVTLATVAIVIGIWVAWKVSQQARMLHDESLKSDREVFAQERYQALVDRAVEILDSARELSSASNRRWSELVGGRVTDPDRQGAAGREAAVATLNRLETRVEMVVLTDKLLPVDSEVGADGQEAADRRGRALDELQDAAAWLVGDAAHAVITHFGDEDEDRRVRPMSRAEVVDELVNGSIVNTPQRLLVARYGFTRGWAPTMAEPGSPWPEILQSRTAFLLEGHDPAEVRTTSLAAEAHAQLTESIERFRDAFFAVVNVVDRDREARFRQDGVVWV